MITNERRAADADANDMIARAQTTGSPRPADKYSVVSSLPKGWGESRVDRSEFYRTPLIVAASVILAILIVTGLIIFAIQRRVHTRRKRRHTARMRRKALAAAGLTEDDLKVGGEDAEVAFQKKLKEVETAYEIKHRGKAKHHRPTAIVRTKVRVWRGGMRRRKPTPGDELKPATSPTGMSTAIVLNQNGSVVSLATTATERTTSTRSSSRSTHHSRLSIHPSNSPTPNTSDQGVSGASEGIVSECTPNSPSMSSNNDPSQGSSEPTQSSPEVAQSSTPPSNMPPAYRPASVRSVEAGPSRGAGSSRGLRPPQVYGPLAPEKRSAGFYPAPTTPDAEEAQAVAQRADAKAPIIPPPEDDDETRMHVATDDKGALERMRLGASAPPVMRVEDADGAGPSAPVFEVDEAGFERLEGIEEAAETATAPQTPAATTDMPAPPTRVLLRSLRTFSDAPSRTESSALLTLPSTPAVEHDYSLTPSAPPLGLGLEPDSPAPSAPPLANDDDDGDLYEATAPPASDDGSDAGDGEPQRDPTQATLTVNGHRFLPVYEP
ncbi:hypothetical protein A1Q1_04162 [Trichosporon asahii var. asahii CBS 2479]|nr:hypothetical protein A1Q1_04162 [Trichosporon asahii var. asahii CBS 2479]EJT47088.1 hypothetical protein A1Q1_04162 [Trichosporon asahii var. asahii CBS 2479]